MFHEPAAMKTGDRRALKGLLAISVACLLTQVLTFQTISNKQPAVFQSIELRLAKQVSLINELRGPTPSRASYSVLDDYLSDIRKDGLVTHTATKQKIDRLASNTEALLALLDTYAPAAQSGPLKKSADDFRRYANVWLDRKNSIMDLYLLGGNFPPGEPEFPKELIQALKQSE